MLANSNRGWRTIFISDVHLGTRGCQAEHLLEFLRQFDAETIYLVGDVVDFWRIRRRAQWSQAHNDVIQKLLRKARKGARVVYVPGNHDEALFAWGGMRFGNIEIVDEAVHTTADGRRLLIIHGDQFDVVVRNMRWLSALGSISSVVSIAANAAVNSARRAMGFGHWSLSAHLKAHVKQATQFISSFERQLCAEARRRGFDGVVCGHVHHAADKSIGGTRYLNCGDWVESCTALLEDHRGCFHLLRWHDHVAETSSVRLEETPLAA